MHLPANVCLSLTLFGSTLVAFAQEPTPMVVPPGCSVPLVVSLSDVDSSSSMSLLRHLLAAIDLGNSADKVALASSKMKMSSVRREESMAALFLGFDQTRDNYLCAAFVMDKFKPTSEDEKAAKEAVITAFFEFAEQTVRMKERSKRKFSVVETGVDESAVESAAEFASLENDRHAAFSDLLTATALSLLTTLTISSPNSDRVDAIKLNCKEKAVVMKQVAMIKINKTGNFTSYATLVSDHLSKPYKCAQMR